METPNLIYIKQLSDGDVTFENKLISILKREFPIEVKQYKKNISLKNNIQTAENVHKIKHKISILGLEKGYVLATSFEKELKKGSVSLQVPFEKILDQISVYLTTI